MIWLQCSVCGMHSFIWFNKPFTKKFYLPVCFVIRLCCRCNTIYSIQYDQCRQNIVMRVCALYSDAVFFLYIFSSVSNFEILFSFVCPFVHSVVLCVCCSFCFVKYEYWQTTFSYNRAHRREMRKKRITNESTAVY